MLLVDKVDPEQSNLKGGDVKVGVRLYINYYSKLEKTSLASESSDSDTLRSLTENIQESLDFKGIDVLVQHPVLQNILRSSIKGDMVCWIDSFLEMVILINELQTGRAIWFNFLPYCFSLNRNKFARNLSYFYVDMIDLQQRNPEAYGYLESGGFTGSTSG